MKQDLSIKVGGEAGQGLQVVGAILSKALARQGLHLFAHQDYYSRVRGGHNFYQVRASSEPIWSFVDQLHVLVALDEPSITLHGKDVLPDGVVVYDTGSVRPAKPVGNSLPIPLGDLGREYGGNAIMGNSVAAGAVWCLISGDPEVLDGVITDLFHPKGKEIIDANLKAARAGADFARREFTGKCGCQLSRLLSDRRMVLRGNEAVALGALAAGCRFISSYPMTPASSIIEHMADYSDRMPIAFEQAEDEIAAIHMAMGASYTGVRSMVATSGGGFSLMVEGLSLAGCTETPLVIIMGQRPGPATGLATRTEQGDLLFCLHAGHGEFPRGILAPGNAEEAFWMTVEAFNLADRYQCPVLVMTDQHLADSYYTVEPFDLSKVVLHRGDILSDEELSQIDVYKRYLLTDGGISPRAFPGQAGKTVYASGNEHDEEGLSTEDAVMRRRMVEKRLKKGHLMAENVPRPVVHGPIEAETVLLTWGSSSGAAREAVDMLSEKGETAKMVHLPGIWPFPRQAVMEAIGSPTRLVCVEMNAQGQLGRLLRQETGLLPTTAVLKYDGRPMNGAYILRELSEGGSFPW